MSSTASNRSKAQYLARRTNSDGNTRTEVMKLFKRKKKGRVNTYVPNRQLLNKLDINPLSYRLPKRFVYINDTDTIEESSKWLSNPAAPQNRQLLPDLRDEYEIIADQYIQSKWNVQSRSGNSRVGISYSFDDLVATYATPVRNRMGLDSIGLSVLGRYKNVFKQRLRKHNGLKFHFSYEVIFQNSSGEVLPPFWVSPKSSQTVTNFQQLPGLLRKASQEIQDKIAEMETAGSGMKFVRAQHVSANFINYSPHRGGTFIKTPDELAKKRALINIDKDNECFKYAVLASLFHKDLTENQKKKGNLPRVYKQFEDKLDFSDLTYPVSLLQIKKFEKKNNVAVNVYQYLKKEVIILQRTTLKPPAEGEARHEANLLLLSDRTNSVHHYVCVSNFSRLISGRTRHDGRTYTCNYCLHTFTTKQAYDNHLPNCASHEAVAVEMPKKGDVMEFKNTFNQVKAPGVIYSDFECFNIPIQSEPSDQQSYTTKLSKQTPNSFKLIGVCSNDKRFFSKKIIKPNTTTKEFMNLFYKEVRKVEDKMRVEFQSKRKVSDMIISHEQTVEHRATATCYLCKGRCYGRKDKAKDVVLPEKELIKLKEDNEGKTAAELKEVIEAAKKQHFKERVKVRDHCHTRGIFLGTACSMCNINRHNRWYKIPVLYHNMMGYDGKILVKSMCEMTKNEDEKKRETCSSEITDIENKITYYEDEVEHLDNRGDPNDEYLIETYKEELAALIKYKKLLQRRMKQPTVIDIIPINTERYLSIQVSGIRFMDSISFLQDSLDNLASNLSDEDKKITKEYFKKYKDISLLLKKGVYPYSWVSDVSKFDATALPTREEWRNDLDGGAMVSEKDYERAWEIWDTYKCKTFRDYHKLYLSVDVTLLADIFEKFRTSMLESHKLEPLYYYSLPGLTWDAMLKHTEIKIDLLYDLEMHLMIEQGIHGGVSFISHRHGKANNKYMKEGYNPKEDSSYLLYIDAVNLYSVGMMSALGYKDHKWKDPNTIKIHKSHAKNLETVRKMVECADKTQDHSGYILEYDLDCPDKIHDEQNLFPMLAEYVNIKKENYSDYQKTCLGDGKTSKISKLIPTVRHKKKYVSDVRLLYGAMRQGFKLKRIHRIIEFTQRDWMKPYIELNTSLRAKAKTKFEKNFFKALNNMVYGKSVERTRDRLDFKIITDKQTMLKATKNPRVELPVHQFDEEVCGVQFKPKKVKLNRPIYIGAQILDLSKITMYDMHYDRILKAYGHENVRLMFTDTDSFCYLIKTEDVYKDMETLDAFKVTRGDGTKTNIWDFSNYPEDHPMYNTDNKKRPGWFNEELESKIILEFVGLRAKMYSFLIQDTEEKKTQEGIKTVDVITQKCTHKGISKKCVIPHSDYKDCLETQNSTYAESNRIMGRNLDLFVVKQRKKALSCLDDKSYILPCGIESLKWGHKDIPPEKNIPNSSNNTVC